MQTPEQIIEELNEIKTTDSESAHITADRLILDYLRSIGHEQAAKAWERAEERCGFWYA
jgi:uncharacterized heparinase superfamily protein